MLNINLLPNFTQKHVLSNKGLRGLLDAFEVDSRTGIVTMDEETGGHILVFVRGMLVTVYRDHSHVERIDPYQWMNSIIEEHPHISVGVISLTPQDIRVFKIMIEQQQAGVEAGGPVAELEQQFSTWKSHPSYGLAKISWPSAESLVLFPGGGQAPIYSLFIHADKLQHSAGSVLRVLSWQEKEPLYHFYNSDLSRCEAWTEFLLHRAFSRLLLDLMKKYEKLASREQLNQIIRDINFKATAHDWNLSITAGSVNDQIILSSPEAVANVYGSLLEVVLNTMKNGLGEMIYSDVLKEMKKQMPPALRQVVQKHIPVVIFH